MPSARYPASIDHAHHQQVLRRDRAIVAVHLDQPRHGPQPLQGEERAHADAAERRDPPEPGVCEHLAHTRPLRLHARPSDRLGRIGDREPDPHGGGKGHRREHDEQRAPVHEAQRELGRSRRGERAQASRRHDPRAQRSLPLARVPRGKGLQRSHQADRDARPDQRAGDGETRHAVRDGKEQRAGARDDEERRLDAARSVPIEQDARRNLQRGERDEVGAGKKAEQSRRDAQLARELRRDHGVDRAVEVRQQIRARKGVDEVARVHRGCDIDPDSAGAVAIRRELGHVERRRFVRDHAGDELAGDRAQAQAHHRMAGGDGQIGVPRRAPDVRQPVRRARAQARATARRRRNRPARTADSSAARRR